MAQRYGLPGIWPAMLTPLDEHGRVDHGRLAAHGRGLIDAGCGGLTPFGTTGEGPSFSVAERIAAVNAMVAAGVPAARILVSTSAASVEDVLALTRHARAIGAYGCLMLPPFYLKGVPDEGIADAYRWVLDRAGTDGLRLVLYHLPQVTGVPLPAAVVRTLLAEYPGTVVAVKDSGGDLAHSLALADAFMPPIGVHVGHEPHLPMLARRGSGGAVSGLANFMPRRVARLVAEPDSAAAADALARVERLLEALRPHALIPALKALQAAATGEAGWLRVRPPLRRLEGPALDAIAAAHAALGADG